jgi:Tfp pilus assembly protein PilF
VELARHLDVSGFPKAALDVVNATPVAQKKNRLIVIERNWALLFTGDMDGAAQGIREALSLGRAPEILLQDATRKLSHRDYSGARASAGEVLKENPQELRALLLWALSYVDQKQPQTALRIIQEHAAQNPKSARVQQFLGEWLLASNSPVPARAAFMAAKAADSSFAPAEFALARLDLSEGKLESVRRVLTGMLNTANAVPARLLLGAADIKAGNRAAAIDHYRKVLDADAQNIVALNNLAYLLADFANQPDEALTYAQRALELAPENADTGGTLGWIFYRKGLYTNALKHLENAVARDAQSTTENALIRKYHLAMTYWKIGDQNRGTETFQSALKINPNLIEVQTARQLLQVQGAFPRP